MKSVLSLVTLKCLTLSTLVSTVVISGFALAGDEVSKAGSTTTFALDDRPVDGVLTAVDFLAGEFGGYDVVLRTEFVDRIQGKAVKTEKLVARSLECEFTASITFVHCEIDKRPVDGAFVKVEASIGRDKKTFEITKETIFINRKTGKEVVSFETIAQGLELQD